MRQSRRYLWAFALIPVGVALFAFILPYKAALALSLGGGAAFRLFIPSSLRFTIIQAFFSVLLALAIGLPGAWFLSGSNTSGADSPGRKVWRPLIRAFMGIPFALPPLLAALGFVLFWGNSGWANRILAGLTGAPSGPLRILYRPEAVILAHGFYNFPLIIRLAGDAFSRIRRSYSAPAASLGSSPFGVFCTVILPLALPSIMAAALLVFLYCFTSFAVVLVLGGGPKATTLAVEIYRYARVTLDYASAGQLALAETGIAGIVFLAYLFFEQKSRSLAVQETAMRPWGKNRHSSAVKIVCLALPALLVLAPLFSVPLESFLYRQSRSALPALSLRWWHSLGNTLLPCLGRSLLLASLSATAACVLAILTAAAALPVERRAPGNAPRLPDTIAGILVRLCATAPAASSGIVLGLGWISFYGREQSRNILALAAVHAMAALPFAFNSVYQGFLSLPANTLAAASVLGAGPFRRLVTLEIPLSAGRIRSAWGFSAALSLGELSAVLMLGMEDWETLPLYIYRAAGAYRYGAACAAGTLLILCSLGAFLLSEVKSSC